MELLLAGPVRRLKRTEEKQLIYISRSLYSSPLLLPTYPQNHLYFISNYCQILPRSCGECLPLLLNLIWTLENVEWRLDCKLANWA